MKTPKKSFQTLSSKPNDVHYRLKRSRETLDSLTIFVSSIDPVVFPEAHAKMLAAIAALAAGLSAAEAAKPAKKVRGAAAEKPVKVKPVKETKVKVAKAVAVAKEKPVKAKAAPATAGQPPFGPDTAIGRALAAAMARRAAQINVEEEA
jgi:hypothetical protein